jgi:hypothetical protein
MSTSTSKAMPSEGVRPRHDQASPDSSPVRRRRSARSGFAVGPGGPEWKSQRWKLQVEAEARSRLKKRIRDLGSER